MHSQFGSSQIAWNINMEATITGEVDSRWIQIPDGPGMGDPLSQLFGSGWIPTSLTSPSRRHGSTCYYGTELCLQISAEICRNGAIAHTSTTQI